MAGRPKGLPKSGGRVAGVPNKGSLSALTVSQIAEARGISPLDVLLQYCTSEDHSLRITAAKELMKYMYPQKRAGTNGLEDYTLEEILAHIEKKMRTIKDVSGPVIESGSSTEPGETVPQQNKIQT